MIIKLIKYTVVYSFYVLPILAFSQNNINNLLTQSSWDTLFPNRAGVGDIVPHPQIGTTDFYKYSNLITAVDEMGNYSIEIRRKIGVSGELITISRKDTNYSYIYSNVDNVWHNSSVQEDTTIVDFANFVSLSSDTNNKRELAAFLANISKETTGGWDTVGAGAYGDYVNWGLHYVHEIGYSLPDSAGTYSIANAQYPPNPLQGYYGRGPIQLSWNYNYGAFSKFLFNDIYVLIDNPSLVQQDGILAFKSAIWFWMMPQYPKPSCHQIMHELWIPQQGCYAQAKMYKKGFAHTNNIINGGLECRASSTSEYTDKVFLRSELYKYYLSKLGFSNSQINLEDSVDYTTTCYDNASSAMENYSNCNQFTLIAQNLNTFKVYPNPTKTDITISSNELINEVEIINSVGQKVISNKPNLQTATLNLEELPSGLYILIIKSSKSNSTIKLIKQG